MYSQLKTCVHTKYGLTDYFKCTIGTRQGCILIPFLFAFYIGELVEMMKERGLYKQRNTKFKYNF